MPEDSEIIGLFFARDEQAIKELSAKYAETCKKISRNILKNELDAEECVNDAFLALWNKIPPEKPDVLKTYLFRIVRNISIAKYHANTSLKCNSYYDAALDELENTMVSLKNVEEDVEAIELSNHIDNFLDTLDKDSRLMFMCRYWFADSISDIAQRFQTNSHNVSVRLSRMRGKLKKYLMKEGIDI